MKTQLFPALLLVSFNLCLSNSSGSAPALAIATADSKVILSWPSSAGPAFALQTTANLVSPAWTNAGARFAVNGQYVVTNALNANARFYRLSTAGSGGGSVTISNAGFDLTPFATGWTNHGASASTTYRSAPNSAEVSGSDICSQTVPVATNTNYKLAAWVYRSATVGVRATDSAVIQETNYSLGYVFVKKEIAFNSGTNATVSIYFKAYGTNSGKVDDFSLTVDDGSSGGGTGGGLDPNAFPSVNFPCIVGTGDDPYWKLQYSMQGNNSGVEQQNLTDFEVAGRFYTDKTNGGMVFSVPNNITHGFSAKYPRTELREMLVGLNNLANAEDLDNNWVLSSYIDSAKQQAKGINGILKATISVDEVSRTVVSNTTFKVGRVIIGQIHGGGREPCRLTYRKLPNNAHGSVYIATSPETGYLNDTDHIEDIVGSSLDGAADPANGFALGERFSYRIQAIGSILTVTLYKADGSLVVASNNPATVDLTGFGFIETGDYLYFKAGAYAQDDTTTTPQESSTVTFYSLKATHGTYASPTPPEP